MQAFRQIAPGFVAGILSLSWIVALAADPASKVSLDIKPQPLDAALNSFAQQSGLQIVYLSGVGKGLTSPRITGDYTAAAALDLLLANTALAYRFLNDRTVEVSVRKEKGAQKSSTATAPAENPGAGLRMAQGVSSVNPDAGLPPPEDTAPAAEAPVSEILVKGSRALNTDIRRTQDSAQPYVILDREALQRSGAANAEEFLRTRLSSASSYVSNSQFADQSGSYSRIALRGLAEAETLILIDGRRVGGRASAGSTEQPDLNAIPLASIERIEVLPSTASAIYGGGATGGVINIILRRDYAGTEAGLTYANTFDTDSARRQMDLTTAFSLEEGKTRVLLSGSYSDANELLERDRGLRQRGRQHILARNPNAILNGANPPLGATANIRSSDGTPLVLDTGLALGFPITSAPAGYAGIASDQGARLAERAGRYNLEAPDSAQSEGLRRSLVSTPAVKTANVTLKREFASWFDAYLELGANRTTGQSFLDNSTGSITLAGGDPGNPFTRPITVTTPTAVSSPTRNTLDNRRAVTGAVVGLPAGWKLNADYTWTWNRASSARPSSISTTLFAADARTRAIDVFRDQSLQPIDFSRYEIPEVRFSPVESSLGTASVRAGGPLLRLPGGPLTATASIERRKTRVDDFRTYEPQSSATLREVLAPQREQTVESVYLEVIAPLMASRMLELQLAGRLDRYRADTANTVTFTNGVPSEAISRTTRRFSASSPTVALRYKPVRDLMLRASYATGYVPPSLAVLAPSLQPPITYPAGAGQLFGWTDPLRGNEFLGEIQLTTSTGNPDLRPEESESVSAGLVLTPRFAPALRLSLDWTRIERTDNLVFLGLTSNNFLREALLRYFPGGTVRETAQPGDPYGVGRIIAVRETTANISRSDVEAFDVAVSHLWQTGEFGNFELSANATHTPNFVQQATPGSPVVETAGVTGKVKWRANGTLAWTRRNWTLAWTTRYFESYYLNTNHTVVASQGSARVPSQRYHDLQVSYEVGAAPGMLGELFAGARINVGVKDVFDTLPPIEVNALSGYYSPFGDALLANYYLSVRKSL